jgi:NAD(P) transhydrogenase subunit beta
MSSSFAIQVAYLLASVLFIFGLRALGSARTARRGMFLAELGMLIAIVGALLDHEVVTYEWIVTGLVIGSLVGVGIALWTPMTAMPQRTALSHALGALAASLVGIAEYHKHGGIMGDVQMVALGLEVMLGSLTFTGSLMAFAKLQGWLVGHPITYRGQNLINLSLLASLVALTVFVIVVPTASAVFYTMVGLATLFGVLLVLPIGAADMPVVIALLNSYAGLAGSATGFAMNNNILIIAGALDGASGLILAILMCKAMNRSLTNVLFGAFGKAPEGAAGRAADSRTTRSASPEEAAALLDAAERVVVVPGYGMAVSQAQHAVKKLADLLERKGTDVRFAIHPVAGRMPGHMNVLLAEAGVEYDKLYDMEQVNDDFAHMDVAIVIGANDVVNPAARNDPASPIFGMPILNVDQARAVIVLKRSMSPGFAGIENELFFGPNTTMVFGDATKTVESLIAELRELSPRAVRAEQVARAA